MPKTIKVPINLLNQSFLVKSPPAKQEHLIQCAQFLDKQLKKLQKAHPTATTEELLFVASLNITSLLLSSDSDTPWAEQIEAQLKALEDKITASL